MWMNEWEIDEAVDRYRDHPVLGPATRTLSNLRDATNRNSDGWPYWQKPSRAAKRLMELIQGYGLDPRNVRFDRERADATVAKLRVAYSPIKAFRTRTGLEFVIEEVN